MTPPRRLLPAVFCFLLSAHGLSSHAWADSSFKGEINAEAGYADNSADSLDAAYGERSHRDEAASLRLMWSVATPSGWSADAAYLAEARHGGDVVLARLGGAADSCTGTSRTSPSTHSSGCT